VNHLVRTFCCTLLYLTTDVDVHECTAPILVESSVALGPEARGLAEQLFVWRCETIRSLAELARPPVNVRRIDTTLRVNLAGMHVTPRILSRTSLPPVPIAPGSRHLVLWHPLEKAFLLLVLASQELWRVAPDGRGELVATGGFPDGFEPQYLHDALFYFDPTRSAPVLLISTYAPFADEGLFLGAWDGTRFAPIAARNGVRTARSDAFVFEATRGVLVHFVGQCDTDATLDTQRKARGAFMVRELGVDGVWKDIDARLPDAGTDELCAGYEPRRGLAVIVDN
jgi:hypothetical protein